VYIYFWVDSGGNQYYQKGSWSCGFNNIRKIWEKT